MITESPPGNGNGARQGADPANENNDAQRIPKGSDSRNRQLLEKRNDVSLFALSEGHRTHYEVVTSSGTWSFNLLFPALGKFDRLVSRIGGAKKP
jgi:hypothetical protein